MKPLLIALAAVITVSIIARTQAETLAVIGKNQIAVLSDNGGVAGISESDSQRDFVLALRDAPKTGAYEVEATLVAPPEWGKTVPGAGGEVQYQVSFQQGFIGHLALHGLEPGHVYLLTLNGTPTTPGNNLLPDPVPGLPLERFYDFMRIVADARGGFDAKLGVYLLPGNYHVRIYVKDAKDFKIVLYRDYFDFNVTPEAPPQPTVAPTSR